MDAARVLVFLKGTDTHDYKFSSAVLEDYQAISPEWATRTGVEPVQPEVCGDADNRLVQRARAALGRDAERQRTFRWSRHSRGRPFGAKGERTAHGSAPAASLLRVTPASW